MDYTVTDIHPSVNEIKPYVSVGPTDELSVTVKKETFDSAFIWVTIIFGLALLILVGLTIFFAYQQSKLPPPPPPLRPIKQNPTLHTNIGAAASPTTLINNKLILQQDGSELVTQQQCEASYNTKWDGSHCECEPPFFGPKCSREKHDKKYYAVGTPNENTLGFTVIDKFISSGKSFTATSSENSCSDRCNKTEDCIGFIYHDYDEDDETITEYMDETANIGMCLLLKDKVIVPQDSTIPYFIDIDPTLYLRSSDNLYFENRIFLGAYIRALPPRYWLVKENLNYIQLTPGEIRKLQFVPTYTKMYNQHTGIYCTHRFSTEEINLLINRGENSECYIHRPGTIINLPLDWKYKTNLYVVYV